MQTEQKVTAELKTLHREARKRARERLGGREEESEGGGRKQRGKTDTDIQDSRGIVSITLSVLQLIGSIISILFISVFLLHLNFIFLIP